MDKGFWDNVDSLRGSTSLRKLCADAGINYRTAIDQRFRNRLPSAEAAARIASALSTDLAALLPQPEAQDERRARLSRAIAAADEEDIILIERMLGIG